ncbi:uncharacterized protein LOC126335669 [Schistocerca gregaria]|uniref:uncharacterized protein LOC126335669 n=1 Tax=Schistocerca gregaria TaxID=7010 RepID=UPI00211E4812|nr:uncharacterized protein LOC126335669 [Schistocerca gregaria]
MCESACNSPARSMGEPSSLTDSELTDLEDNSLLELPAEQPGGPDLTIVDGWLRFRDNKRWKQRWGVVTKLSPAAGKKFSAISGPGEYNHSDNFALSVKCNSVPFKTKNKNFLSNKGLKITGVIRGPLGGVIRLFRP